MNRMSAFPPRLVPLALCLVALGLSGCAVLQGRNAPEPAAEPARIAPPQRLPGIAAAQTADQLDRTSAAERAAALAAAPAAGAELGRVRVSLGSPAEQGFWLKSALVSEVRQGRVSLAGGASVAVELRPGAGAAQLSLAAYRALGLGLTDLPEVIVTAN